MDKKILNHFKINDPVLYSYTKKIGKLAPIKRDKPENYFYRLCREIVCQQLSDKAGEAIFSRFKNLFPDGLITVSAVLSFSHEKLRASGMSNAKVSYLQNLAQETSCGNLRFNSFDSLTDEQILKELTRVKGIGPWTAQMFLMFTLGRENVFSHGDLGLRKGIKKFINLKPNQRRIG